MIGVSSDPQVTSDRFRAELGLPFPLVGDADGVIGRAYGVRWPLLPWTDRVTYVIRPDRKVVVAHRGLRDTESHVAIACAYVARPPK